MKRELLSNTFVQLVWQKPFQDYTGSTFKQQTGLLLLENRVVSWRRYYYMTINNKIPTLTQAHFDVNCNTNLRT